MDHDHRARSASTTTGAAAHSALPPGKRTLTESIVVQRREAAAPGAELAPSRTAASATAGLAVRGTAGPALQMLFEVQRVAVAAPAQDTAQVHAAAARGTATAAARLPFADRIQRLFGRHDISSIQAHTGPEATASAGAMGARAYATGDHVVLGDGADLHTVAHEAAHIVQQRAGVHLKGGVGTEGDVYEQHADAVAEAVVSGRSAEPLLDRFAGGAPGRDGVQQTAVQRYIAIGPKRTDVKSVEEAMTGIQHEAEAADPSNILGALQSRDQAIRAVLAEWLASSGEFLTNALEYSKAVVGQQPSPQPAQWRQYRNFYELGVAVVYETHPQTVANKQYEGQLANAVVQDPWINQQLNNVRDLIYRQLQATVGDKLLKEFTSELDGDALFSMGKFRGSYRQIGSYVEGGGMKLNVMNFLQQLQAGFQTNIAVIHDMMEHLSGPGGGAKFPTSLGGTLPEPRDEAYETTLLTDAPRDFDFEDDQPETSIERRTRMTPKHKAPKGELTDLSEEMEIDKKGMKGRTNVGTRDVKDIDTITGMMMNAPMLAGKSMTTARMMELVVWAGGAADDKIAVAWAIFAYWKALYPASTVPFHTFHEVMDIARNYGVPYAPFYYPDLDEDPQIDYHDVGTKKFNENVPDQ